MHVLPLPPKINVTGRLFGALDPSRGSAGTAEPEFLPFSQKRTSQQSTCSYPGLLVLLLCLIMTAAFRIATVQADDVPVLGMPAAVKNVYFGTYNEKPVLWRVIGTGNAGSGMLLLSEYLLGNTQFNPDQYAEKANVWQGSTAQSWCGDFFSKRFTEAEQLSMIQTKKTDEVSQGTYIPFGTSSLEDEYVFFLSGNEAETNFDNNSRKAYFENESSASTWWLRSPQARNDFRAGRISQNGNVLDGIVSESSGARPAFNLNLSSVLFSSEISSESESPKQYKLTLKDEDLSISVTENAVVTRNGSTVTIPYTNSSGTKAYVMVTDKAYTESDAKVLYYAALTTGGTGTFTIDSSWETDYQVYLLAVNEGGEKKTDTASTPVVIKIPKSDQTVTAPTAISNLTYDSSAQTLISAGTAENGTMMYAVTTENTKPADTAYIFTNSSLPTGTDAMTYYVWYMSIGNKGYNDYVGQESITVTVKPADPEIPADLTAAYGQMLADVSLPKGWAWADGSVSVGGAGTKTFKANYTSDDPNYNSLSNVDLTVTVKPADTPTPEPTDKPTPEPTKEPTLEPTPEPTRECRCFRGRCGGCRLPATGFSAVRPSALPEQPKVLSYEPLRMRIMIPTLDVDQELVRVPLSGDTWPVEWLGDRAGLLSGTGMPGQGLSVVAAHNTLNDTEFGPFARLVMMEVNDLITVTDRNGGLSLFRVYANELLDADGADALLTIAGRAENTLVLLTCENESAEGGYLSRRVVFAEPVR